MIMIFKYIIKISLVTFLILLTILLLTGCVIFGSNIPGKMPETSFNGLAHPLTQNEISVKEDLNKHILFLSEEIGPRLMEDGSLNIAAEYITKEFSAMGYKPTIQDYKIDEYTASNIIAELRGTKYPEKVLVVGAHYDTGKGIPGANDNASGVAATLALAKIFSDNPQEYTILFIAFANEEPPYFHSHNMGSLVFAKKDKEENQNIVGMMSLETMGYFNHKKGSQKYPPPLNWFYPDTGNFIGFVSNPDSKNLLNKTIASFRKNAEIASEGGIISDIVPGIDWSDHWSFWKVGYPAIMVTDTAIFRYPHYHKATDTIDKIDFDSLTRVITGLKHSISAIANE